MAQNTVDRLEGAFREVLGQQFEVEIRALVDGETWYDLEIDIEEVFRLWVAKNLEQSTDALWIFAPLRVSERRFLCDKLGIDRRKMVGKTPEELAADVLLATGWPVPKPTGNRLLIANWQRLVSLVDNDDSERAAVSARQRAERLLRTVLYFYCATKHSREFVSMLENPGSLRLPARLSTEMAIVDAERNVRVSQLLSVDGWADLGFLALALRKYSERLAESRAQHPSGAPLKLFTVQEYEAFSKLGTALQPYTHDRPSKYASMRQDLRDSLLEIVTAVSNMLARGILPDEMFVVETGMCLIGPVFKCLLVGDSSRYFRSAEMPIVGHTILAVPSVNYDYAMCQWVDSPW
jgi:hypothetical protein